MAIKPVDTRIDQMLPEMGVSEQPQTILFDEAAQQQPMEEGVQVAGLIGKLGKISKAQKAVKQTQKAAGKAVVDPLKRAEGEYIIPETPAKKEVDSPLPADATAEQVKQVGVDQLEKRVDPTMQVNAPPVEETRSVRVEDGQIFVKPASPEALQKLSELVAVAKTSGKPPLVRPNLDRIGGDDSLKKAVYATHQYYSDWVAEQRRAGRTTDDMIKDAAEIGDVSALKLLAQRKAGDRPLLDDETLAARIAVLNLQLASKESIQAAKKSGDPVQILNALKMTEFTGYTSAALDGTKSEAARSLAVNALIAAPDKGRTLALQKIIEQTGIDNIPSTQTAEEAVNVIQELGGMSQVNMALDAFLALPDASSREIYTKGLFRASLDAASEIYQSALLSNPVTHSFNAIGTPIHASMIMAERALAAAYRSDIDSIIGVSAGLRAIPRYFKQSLASAWRAAKTELPSDATTRNENSRISTKAENFGVAPDTPLGMAIDAVGVGTRAFGFRILTTVDEGFKSMLRGMEMEMIAAEAQSKSFRAAMADGMDEASALELSAKTYERTLQAESTFLEASEFARIATFQDDLPGATLGRVQEFMAHPLAKLLGFPFFKTTAQISLRVQERTPLAVVMPRFWKAITNPSDPKERSIAISKLTLSSTIANTILMTDYLSDDEVRFTGYGPTNPAVRRTWLQKNEPYSFGTKQPDGSYKWQSYARYDPFSGALAMMADVRDTVMHIDDPEEAENLVFDMGLATMHYMGETNPAVQFTAELANIIGPQYEGEEDKFERIGQLLQRQVVDSALVIGQSVATGGIAPQSLTATFQRYVDPYAKSTIPDDQYAYLDMPGWKMSLRGAYEGIQKARSRSGFFSDETLTQTNDWFEPVKRGFGDYTTFMPTRITEKRFSGIVEELERINGGFKPLPKGLGESMIKLNDSQFERYKELVNYPGRATYAAEEFFGVTPDELTDDQRAYIEQMPSLADHLIDWIYNPEVNATYKLTFDEETGEIRDSTKGEKMDSLNTERARFMNQAKKLLLREYPELKDLMDQRDKFKSQTGQLPRSLPLSPETLSNLK